MGLGRFSGAQEILGLQGFEVCVGLASLSGF